MDNFLFDGQVAEKTNKDKWYKLNKIPSEVLGKKPDERINKRYELKAGYQPTELMPNIITMEMYDSDEYEDIMWLYSLKYDTKKVDMNQLNSIFLLYIREKILNLCQINIALKPTCLHKLNIQKWYIKTFLVN